MKRVRPAGHRLEDAADVSEDLSELADSMNRSWSLVCLRKLRDTKLSGAARASLQLRAQKEMRSLARSTPRITSPPRPPVSDSPARRKPVPVRRSPLRDEIQSPLACTTDSSSDSSHAFGWMVPFEPTLPAHRGQQWSQCAASQTMGLFFESLGGADSIVADAVGPRPPWNLGTSLPVVLPAEFLRDGSNSVQCTAVGAVIVSDFDSAEPLRTDYRSESTELSME